MPSEEIIYTYVRGKGWIGVYEDKIRNLTRQQAKVQNFGYRPPGAYILRNIDWDQLYGRIQRR